MKLKKFRRILFFFKKIFIVITEQQFIPQTKDLWDFLLSLFKKSFKKSCSIYLLNIRHKDGIN